VSRAQPREPDSREHHDGCNDQVQLVDQPSRKRVGREDVAERMIEAHGLELCTESFGDPTDPPVLLIMGIGGSMLWWEEGFCRMLAEGGRFVIRYDHRDTGRSVTYEPGRPEYTGTDLVADAVGVLDAYDIPAAHVVGVSAGGAFAQLLALGFPTRVLTLVLISTSPATPGERGLPPTTDRYRSFLATAEVNWSDEESVIEYLVGHARVLAGSERPFDEGAMRELVRRDVDRARDIRASENHGVIAEGEVSREPLSTIAAPTLVIHGTADRLVSPSGGRATARAIPGARLMTIEGMGHDIPRAVWPRIIGAIVENAARAGEGAAARA
jgi:pimeloyl-ACP methyl ester carboxylesterase